MEKIFNVILIIGLLVTLYFCIQKYKKDYGLISISDKQNIVSEEKPIEPKFNTSKGELELVEKFNMDKIYLIETEPNQTIKFNYGELRSIDKQFQKEQDHGVGLKTWYPNTWIERINENGEPVYGSREKQTDNVENFIESKARFSYEFNSPRSLQMDGIADPDDFINGQGRTLKEVYDNSFVDYKKLEQKKKVIGNSFEQTYSQPGASNLSFISPDSWIYENEKAENGGQILNGLFASDPLTYDSVAIFE